MFKRGIGHYVVLSLCILGLVFQPITIFADTIYDAETLGRFIKPFSSILDEDVTLSNTVFDIASYYSLSLYDLSASNVVCFRSPNNGIYLYFMPSTYHVTMNVPTPNSSASYAFYNGISSDRLVVNFYYYLNGSYGSGSSNSTSFSTIGTILFISDDMTTNDGRSIFVSVGSGSGSGGSGNPSDWPSSSDITTMLQNLYLQNGLMYGLNFHCATPDGQTIFNSSWSGVAEVLTYDFLCKTNPNQPNVSVASWDGVNHTYSNYIYENNQNIPNYTDTLALINSRVNSILINTSTTNSRLNTINNSVNAVNNNLNTIFPSDERLINDSIADAVLDDSNDSGLTTSKITTTKSDLDDGLSAFEVDTSGSVYSSPFAAISNPDNWLFFSQDTAANLQVQPVEASLQGVDNSSDLPYYNSVNQQVNNMMGWGD